MSSIPVAIWRFSDNNFKRFYLKKKTHFFFDCISKMCMKFRTLWKKEQDPSLIITKIIASEIDVYLSV